MGTPLTEIQISQNITPVYIQDRDNLLREENTFQSRIDNSNDFTSKFNEIIALTSNQGNPAAGHLDEFISAQSQSRVGDARGLHDQLLGLFRNLQMENESLAAENGSLSNQCNVLIGYVNQYKEWQSNVMWQLDQNRNAASQVEGLNLKIQALQGNESGFLTQIDSLRLQIAEFEKIKREHGQLSTQNQYLNGHTQNLSLKLNEFESLRLEVGQLRNERANFELALKSQADGFASKYQNLELVNRSLSEEIKRLNAQMANYNQYKIEHEEMRVAHVQEQERVMNKAKQTLAQGYNSNSKLKNIVARDGYQEKINTSIYSNPVYDQNLVRDTSVNIGPSTPIQFADRNLTQDYSNLQATNISVPNQTSVYDNRKLSNNLAGL